MTLQERMVAVYLRQAKLPPEEKDKLRLFLGLLLTTFDEEEEWEKEIRVEAAPQVLSVQFEAEPVKGHPDPVGEPGEPGVPEELREEFARAIHGDCSLEERPETLRGWRWRRRMAMEKKEAETGESGT